MDFVSRLSELYVFMRRLRAGAFFNLTQTERRKMQMEDYKKMYLELFNKITDTIETLKKIQQEAEETFITSNDDVTTVSNN